MKNITIPAQFFTQVLTLRPVMQQYVLSVCESLVNADESTIMRYNPTDDAPEVLVDFIKRLKRRIINSRKRRERHAAAAKQTPKQAPNTTARQSAATTDADDSRASADTVVEMYEQAVDLVVSSSQMLNRADRARIRQLAKALMKRMGNISALPATSPGRHRRA
ncbi:MAG: hypothetical protein K2K86_08720 [Muribaculaceae bacterium]|nr:hypothetical protein [Muribaculaceae bacterium]